MRMQHEYSDNQVTPWGGMQEMKILLEKTGISKKMLELGLPQGKSNNSIDSISIIESFWVSIWIGCFRFSHTAVVRLDEVLRQIFGWKRVASGTTFGRFFKKPYWRRDATPSGADIITYWLKPIPYWRRYATYWLQPSAEMRGGLLCGSFLCGT
jgi:hypothetical protein